MAQICENCFNENAEQFLQEEGLHVCDNCLEEILKNDNGVEVMPKKVNKKDNRVTVRLTADQLEMIDYLKSKYSYIKIEMTDSEVLRLALVELADRKGYKNE